MGEAKRSRKLREEILAHFPHCIYCGGVMLATTLDHVPNRAVFNLRHRPRGLEFPACQRCNDGGRPDELAVAWLSRMYPDVKTEQAKAELRRLVRGVRNNCPGLLEEMQPNARQMELAQRDQVELPRGAHLLSHAGPLVNRAVHRFGAKIGYALHFQQTRRAVPLTGAAFVWWITNYQAIQGDMPHELVKMLGSPETLRQGNWDVGDQFRYSSRATSEGTMSAHFATFRFSFAICAVVAERADMISVPKQVEHVTTHRPGWLTAVDGNGAGM